MPCICLSYRMIRIALQTCLTVMALLISASVSVAADCADDPNECTLKKLCEVATTVDGGNTIWSTASGLSKHVALAQGLGMECSVTPIVDLCETDPSECKVSEICGKATTDNGGQISWDDSAAGHVALAKEYGLSCDVVVEEVQSTGACNLTHQKACDDPKVLCSFATTYLGQWETSSHFIQYVKEAKKRGLTCGVKPVVQKVCSGINTDVCSPSLLCEKASFQSSGGSKHWRKGSLYTSFIFEAKKRGLTCGVKAVVEKTCSASTLEVCTNETVCRRATTKSGNKWEWENQAYVKEAKKRGRDCGVKAQVKKTCSASTPEECTNGTVCRHATTKSGNKWEWEKTNYQIYQAYVKEAKKRGLTCGVKAVVEKTCSTKTPEVCSSEELCRSSTEGSGNSKTWTGWSAYENYVKEAKKRGLSCGVTTNSNSYASAQFDRSDFSSLSSVKQKQLQYGLKKLGYYRSSIDGLYGPKTEKAVRDYARSKGINSGYPDSVYKRIVSEVNVPNSFSSPKRSTSSKSNKSTRQSNSRGMRAITSNPTKTADRAYELCKIQASAAYAQAYANLPLGGYDSYIATCNEGILYDYKCTVSPNSGGFYGGASRVLDKAVRANGVRNGVLNSCLAHYGWKY